MNPNIKLYINFSLDNGYGYNILDVIDTECLRLELLYHTVVTNHIFHSQNHGMLTDEDINDLYNMSDLGINTCFGEGFGLCNAEQASLGIPQIISAVGGFTDIFEGEHNMLVQPVVTMRLPNHMDAVRGDLHICLAEHFADKIQYYYHNPDKRLEDGTRISKKINQRYDWKTILPKMFAELQNIVTNI